MTLPSQKQRQRVHVNGIVQGVGFRPFVYNLARHHELSGFVTNTSTGVWIEIEGQMANIESFLNELKGNPPPLAVLNEITSQTIEPVAECQFRIRASDPAGDIRTQISPDAALCQDCLQELFDPGDRRYRYPFINCTHCGPRYTITRNLPYDRNTTSMAEFAMCPECQTEYNLALGRRFHAQANCCPACGPQVFLHNRDGVVEKLGDAAMRAVLDRLKSGAVVAIKGLGGFHLAVDATNNEAVALLRQRKGRQQKPFAIMVRDLDAAQTLCRLDREQEQALCSMQRPIVLAERKGYGTLAPEVAPDNDLLGVMLPYTPLHYLLFDNQLKILVMTSGNYSEDPISITNADAFRRLSRIADYFLTHNRKIYLRNDDSIVTCMAGEIRLVRRSRGYAPRSLPLANGGPSILGVGGELKNTVCLLKNRQAFLSQHVGDLKNLEAFTSFQQTIAHLQLVFEIDPKLIVHDLHPGYLSTQWALDQTMVRTLGVQHHHAHMASCLAENGAEGPAIGVIMDGTGYGPDGTIRGGEILIGDFCEFHRFGQFEPMPLPGGDAAIQEPWRIGLAYLAATFGQQLPDLGFLRQHEPGPILEMIAKQINTPYTSSCGRLFDAVAALAGGRQIINYEAQAAIELMQAAGNERGPAYDSGLHKVNGVWHMSVQAIIRSVVNGLLAGESLTTVSRRFHQTLINLLVEAVLLARQKSGITTIALSGGVFQNQLLFEGLHAALARHGLNVFSHSRVPTNDGCLALGQAVIGRAHLLRG
jgi:hydrogenase maturation protein HypF